MARSGLLVKPAVLDAAVALAEHSQLPVSARWGMSPFGGDTQTAIWRAIDPRILLREDQVCSRWQAAFRLAYALPDAGCVAVGTGRPDHLRELVVATDLAVRDGQLRRYRQMLSSTAAS